MFRGLFGAVERVGVPRAKLMAAIGMRVEELAQPKERLGIAKFARACEVAVLLTGDPALGLHWAQMMNERGFGPISEGLGHASSLRHAFVLLERFEKFFTDTASFEVVESREEATVRIPVGADHSLLVRRFLTELSVAWFVRLVGSICPEAPITRVSFAYEAPPYADEYTRVFGAVVHFAAPVTEVGFPRAWLDAPRRSPIEQSASASTATHGELGERGSCAHRLHQLLLERASERMSMPEAARALGLGERSLRRRLAAEGRSFKEVEFQVLADVAKQLLSAEQRTIEEVAHAMGFSGPNAFYRAFKRWTGQSPSNYQPKAAASSR